jgi:hypothetical protein
MRSVGDRQIRHFPEHNSPVQKPGAATLGLDHEMP